MNYWIEHNETKEKLYGGWVSSEMLYWMSSNGDIVESDDYDKNWKALPEQTYKPKPFSKSVESLLNDIGNLSKQMKAHELEIERLSGQINLLKKRRNNILIHQS